MTRLLAMCNGDAALMMSWYGLAGSLNNTFAVFLSPIVGASSFLIWAVVGGAWWHAIGLTSTA